MEGGREWRKRRVTGEREEREENEEVREGGLNRVPPNANPWYHSVCGNLSQ